VYNITRTRLENGAGATPTFGRRRRGGAQLLVLIRCLRRCGLYWKYSYQL